MTTTLPINWQGAMSAAIAARLSFSWFKLFVLVLLAYIFFKKDISIEFSIGAQERVGEQAAAAPARQPEGENAKMSILPAVFHENETTEANPVAEKTASPKWKDRTANTFSNLTFVLSPDYAERKGIDPAIAKEKIAVCEDYVKRYAPVAIEEMRRFGIPASITLAQGLLESNAGDSRLSVESNNHFGIKCRSKCRGCTCRNYTDDSVFDMFRVFDSPWQSFREHSKLLTSARYKHLQRLDISDYKAWAHGLKKAGYATDKRYAQKLIKIIEELELYKYDGQA